MFELLSIPAVLAAVEALKMAGLPSKFAAIVAIVIGALLGLLMADVLQGIVFGLAASGTYSGIKALTSQ